MSINEAHAPDEFCTREMRALVLLTGFGQSQIDSNEPFAPATSRINAWLFAPTDRVEVSSVFLLNMLGIAQTASRAAWRMSIVFKMLTRRIEMYRKLIFVPLMALLLTACLVVPADQSS